MQVNVLYDKYNTKIEKATLLFGDTPETEQSINLEIIQEIEEILDEEDVVLETIITDKVKITNIDSNSIEIENKMDKEELRAFLTLIRNLLVQL